LYKIPIHDAAHGFLPGRSIVTNAQPHIGSPIVINLDLKDFFPSISYKRVKGLFKSFGYSDTASKIFSLLCTATFSQKASYLPQGAPTSPAITNLISRRMDRRLTGLASFFGMNYTRYADDLTFSKKDDNQSSISNLLHGVHKITREEGFEINEVKTKVFRSSSRQEVTGLVVNQKLNIDRETLRRFRALLFQIEQDGLEGKHWKSLRKSRDILDSIEGFANFVFMVNPEKGAGFVQRVRTIRKQRS
jgi:RNA-directed DNA polymerase